MTFAYYGARGRLLVEAAPRRVLLNHEWPANQGGPAGDWRATRSNARCRYFFSNQCPKTNWCGARNSTFASSRKRIRSLSGDHCTISSAAVYRTRAHLVNVKRTCRQSANRSWTAWFDVSLVVTESSEGNIKLLILRDNLPRVRRDSTPRSGCSVLVRSAVGGNSMSRLRATRSVTACPGPHRREATIRNTRGELSRECRVSRLPSRVHQPSH